MSSVYAVHWPDNADEPVWLFANELDAHRFAASIADPANVTSEPILDSRDAAVCLKSREQRPIAHG